MQKVVRLISSLIVGIVLAGVAAMPVVASETVEVGIEHMKFTPQVVKIKPGTTVKWVNRERRTNHSIVLEGFPESERFFPGESWQHAFDKPGTYTYRCGPHPEMTGTVEVSK